MYKLMDDLRKLNYDLYDEADKIREHPYHQILKLKTSERNLELAKAVLYFVKNADILQRTGMAFLNCKEYTVQMQKIVRKLEDEGEYKGKYDGLNQFKYDQTKLKKIFPDQLMIHRLMQNETEQDGTDLYDEYRNQLETARSKFNLAGSKSNLRLKLRKVKAVRNPKISDEEFKTFINIIKWYTPRNMEKMQRHITDEQIQYFEFILKGKGLNETDLKRMKVIQDMLTVGEPNELVKKEERVIRKRGRPRKNPEEPKKEVKARKPKETFELEIDTQTREEKGNG